MVILYALLQAVIVSIVVIIVLLIPIFFILGKLKNKDKVSLTIFPKTYKDIEINKKDIVEYFEIILKMLDTVSKYIKEENSIEKLESYKRIIPKKISSL